jgi:hypothetical protein
MKKQSLIFFTLLVCSLFLSESLLAQYSDFSRFDRRTETLISKDASFGGFGSLMYGVSEINGEMVYMRGRRAAFIMNLADNHTINLGLGEYRSGSNFDPVDWNVTGVNKPEMKLKYGGFEFEYINSTRKLVHFGFQVLVGGGHIEFSNRNINVEKTRDNIFIVQPGLNLHLNVTTWLRLTAGGSYRFVNNSDLIGTSDNDLSGFAAMFGFRVGKF